MKEIKTRKYNDKPNSTSFKRGHLGMKEEKNPNWKGDDVGYTALHNWLHLQLGQPRLCSKCGTTSARKYEWSNISGEYRRDVKDWERLCVSCHRLKDGHGFKMWKTRRPYA